jgi:hypothetical protein
MEEDNLGTGPESELLLRTSFRRNCPMSVDGIDPVSILELRSRDPRYEMLPSEDGIDPIRLLELRSREFR